MIFYITALFFAIEKNNVEIVKLLLSNNKIDVNVINILNIQFFNTISNNILQLRMKL